MIPIACKIINFPYTFTIYKKLVIVWFRNLGKTIRYNYPTSCSNESKSPHNIFYSWLLSLQAFELKYKVVLLACVKCWSRGSLKFKENLVVI